MMQQSHGDRGLKGLQRCIFFARTLPMNAGASINRPSRSWNSMELPSTHQLLMMELRPTLPVQNAMRYSLRARESQYTERRNMVFIHRLRDYVQSATCPGCLKYMWTSARVVQHLRYRPNRCFDRIFASCIPRGHEPEDLPEHLRRVKRLPTSRYKHGPLLPLPHEKERVLLRERLQECEAGYTVGLLEPGEPCNSADGEC